MPAISNITVKKADGTTDIVYTGLVPSSGDGAPAIWRSESVGTAAAFRAVFKLSARDNGPKTARRVDFAFTYPQIATDTTTTLTSVVNQAPLTGSFVIPKGMPDATVSEAVHQAFNLLSSALIKSSVISGYAPT